MTAASSTRASGNPWRTFRSMIPMNPSGPCTSPARRAKRALVDDAPHGGFVTRIDGRDQCLAQPYCSVSLRRPSTSGDRGLVAVESALLCRRGHGRARIAADREGLGQLWPWATVRFPRRRASRHRGTTRSRADVCMPGFRGLVTNTMAFGLERAPQIAKDCGFEHVVAKLWWQNEELLGAEKANLDAAVDAVDAVCVGNEIIQKGIADHDRLVRELDEARARFGVPVTTGFQPPDWQYFPDLATSVGDFSFLNVHPWWVLHRNDPLTAANWVDEAYRLVAGTPGIAADRVVVVQETSFPSAASPPESAPGATPENQKRSTRRCSPPTSRSSGSSPSTRRCTAWPPAADSGACGTRTGNPSQSSGSSRQPYRAHDQADDAGIARRTMAYTPHAWDGFFAAQAAASAALAGLLFVGMSINIAAITASKRLSRRALEAFVLLVEILLLWTLVLIPDVSHVALGWGLLGVGVVAWAMVGAGPPDRRGQPTGPGSGGGAERQRPRGSGLSGRRQRFSSWSVRPLSSLQPVTACTGSLRALSSRTWPHWRMPGCSSLRSSAECSEDQLVGVIWGLTPFRPRPRASTEPASLLEVRQVVQVRDNGDPDTTAIDIDHRAMHERGFVTNQVHGGVGDGFGHSASPAGVPRIMASAGSSPAPPDPSGSGIRITPDGMACTRTQAESEFGRPRPGQGLHRSLGGAVQRADRDTEPGDPRTQVDDRSAAVPGADHVGVGPVDLRRAAWRPDAHPDDAVDRAARGGAHWGPDRPSGGRRKLNTLTGDRAGDDEGWVWSTSWRYGPSAPSCAGSVAMGGRC